MFFGSVSKLEIVTDPKHIIDPHSPDVIIFNFTDLLSIDNSALDIIEKFQKNLLAHGKILVIAGANGHPLKQMERLGMTKTLGKYLVGDMDEAIKVGEEFLEEKRLQKEKKAAHEDIRIVEK